MRIQFLCIFTIAWYYQYFLKHSNSYGQFPHDGLFILFYLEFVATPCGIWDLGSLTKDRIHIPALEGRALIMGPPGKSRHMMVLIHLSLMTYDIQHLIMCVFCIPLWLNVYANISPIFKGFFFLIFSLLSFVNLLHYILYKPLARHDFSIPSPNLWHVFSFS